MKGKRIRNKGKIKLSRYFKKFEKGDDVAIVRELGVKASFPKRMRGKIGKIEDFRGSYNLVKIKDGGKTKTFIIHPIHLKKLERSEKVETKKNKELDKNTKEKTK